MRVLVFDPYVTSEPEGVKLIANLKAGLSEADYVSLHAPKTPETTHIIDGAAIEAMRPGATLVNVARGGLVDESALHSALVSGRLRAAGLDVFEHEPPAEDNPILSCAKIVATPHSAAFTAECAGRMSMACAQNVVNFFDGRLDPDLVVNKDVLENLTTGEQP
jgi:D-3-phosphoglycerate dehydrogenase